MHGICTTLIGNDESCSAIIKNFIRGFCTMHGICIPLIENG